MININGTRAGIGFGNSRRPHKKKRIRHLPCREAGYTTNLVFREGAPLNQIASQPKVNFMYHLPCIIFYVSSFTYHLSCIICFSRLPIPISFVLFAIDGCCHSMVCSRIKVIFPGKSIFFKQKKSFILIGNTILNKGIGRKLVGYVLPGITVVRILSPLRTLEMRQD